MSIFICMHTYTCMFAYIYEIYVCMYMHTNIHLPIYTHICINAYSYMITCIHSHVSLPIYIPKYRHSYMYVCNMCNTYIHTYMPMHVCLCTWIHMSQGCGFSDNKVIVHAQGTSLQMTETTRMKRSSLTIILSILMLVTSSYGVSQTSLN